MARWAGGACSNLRQYCSAERLKHASRRKPGPTDQVAGRRKMGPGFRREAGLVRRQRICLIERGRSCFPIAAGLGGCGHLAEGGTRCRSGSCRRARSIPRPGARSPVGCRSRPRRRGRALRCGSRRQRTGEPERATASQVACDAASVARAARREAPGAGVMSESRVRTTVVPRRAGPERPGAKRQERGS